MDCFAVSIASGIILKRVQLRPMLIMALAFGFFQALMPLLGWIGASFFSHLIESIDHWIAFGILAFLGGRMIMESFKDEDCKHEYDPTSLKVVLALAVATSIDALAVGVSFAFLGIKQFSAILSPIGIIGFVSFALSMVGLMFGIQADDATLARLDPAAAARLQPRDAQRIQRALEIVRLTGRPLAESYARRSATPDTHRYLPLALMPSDRSVLHARIERRFDTMLLAGFVDEVAALRDKYHLTPEMPSMRCVGYRQALEYLDGHVSLGTFREKGIFATRQLAKRQITWQRNFRDNWAELIEVDSLAPDAEARVRARVETGLG